MTGIVKAWSPSLLESYEACPRRAKLERIDKLCPKCFKGRLKGFEAPVCDTCKANIEQPPPLVRGTLIHGMAESFITGREVGLPEELGLVGKVLSKLKLGYKKRLVRVEVELAVDWRWKPVSWFDKSAWLRTKLDALHFLSPKSAEVTDWKTGRYKPDSAGYSDQLHIYATAAMSTFDLMDSVSARLVFTDSGEVVEKPEGTVTRATLEQSKKTWAKRALPLFKDKRFAPTPSMACRWCSYSRNKGGPCEF